MHVGRDAGLSDWSGRVLWLGVAGGLSWRRLLPTARSRESEEEQDATQEIFMDVPRVAEATSRRPDGDIEAAARLTSGEREKRCHPRVPAVTGE